VGGGCLATKPTTRRIAYSFALSAPAQLGKCRAQLSAGFDIVEEIFEDVGWIESAAGGA